MTNTTTPLPLAEQVKKRIAEHKNQIIENHKSGFISGTESAAIEAYEQVLSMIDKTAKELEAKRLEAEQALPKCYPYDRQDAATFGEMNAYGHALALLIKPKEEGEKK